MNWTDYLCRREQYSNVTIEWDIPEDQHPGLYRLVHYGHARTRNDTVEQYTGKASYNAIIYIYIYINNLYNALYLYLRVPHA